MTHTLELPESVERVLAEAAARRGVAFDAYLIAAAQEMAALDAREDAEDLADARHAMAQSAPDDVVSWESLKAEMDARKAA